MALNLNSFERIVRIAHAFTEAGPVSNTSEHPFDERNIHPDLPAEVRRLFDNGHYAQATFEALKYLDEEIQRISGDSDFGKSLMMRVFGGISPRLPLNPGMTASEQSEQEGFKFIFAGTMAGIRNPRGHKSGLIDDPDTCLDHLSLTSMLLRKLEEAGLR
ncbi:TIGR02391 family protein [Luteimonas deserti]|uniref:TIGR02391 family protein n=1 Tax=Luteimonas deserti TaxID=2752306 RepID=A0A7Z0TU74_9GAMM|nr:TIGR02391 family protein [Luteimonas deserti]